MSIQTLNLPPDLREALDEAVRRIVEIARPDLIILFGSWAEGKASADSDVDLIVVMETDEPYGVSARLYQEVEPVLGGRGLDIIVFPRDQWPHARTIRGMVAWEADRFGVRLHERAA